MGPYMGPVASTYAHSFWELFWTTKQLVLDNYLNSYIVLLCRIALKMLLLAGVQTQPHSFMSKKPKSVIAFKD